MKKKSAIGKTDICTIGQSLTIFCGRSQLECRSRARLRFSVYGTSNKYQTDKFILVQNFKLPNSICRFYYEKCPEVVNEQKTVYVEIALYLINIHSVDLKAGTFHADFYLYFKGNFFLRVFLRSYLRRHHKNPCG